MASLTSHLVRRGMEGFHATMQQADAIGSGSEDKGDKIVLPAWGLTLVAFTVVLFSFLLLAIQYTYGEIVTTLASIEIPHSTAIIRTSPPTDTEADADVNPDAPLLSRDEKSQDQSGSEQEVLLIQQKPLTSSFRAIKRHLRATGGRLARFRGLHVYLLNALLFNLLVGVFLPLLPMGNLSLMVVEVGAYTILTRFMLLWNHIVISEPSTKSWFARLPARSVVVKALAPTVAYATLTKGSVLLFMGVTQTVQRMYKPTTAGEKPVTAHLVLGASVIILSVLFLTLAIQIPAEIAMIRVRASLLSNEDEPIVPFDRSFGGQVIPAVAGGSGVLGLWQAWAGCDMATRFRVLNVYLKTFALQVFVSLVAIGLVAVEFRVMLGAEFVQKLPVVAMQGFKGM